MGLSYISIDLETTGFSPTANEIIDIGAWKVKDGVVIDKFSRLVKPICSIPRDIQAITHITDSMVKFEEPIESVLVEFFDWCEDLNFLGHNLTFDYNFLVAKGKPLGLDFTLKNERCGYDTLKIAKKFLNLDNYKLETLVNYYGIDVGNNFHRASFDAYATKLVFDRFILQFPVCKIATNLNEKCTLYGEVTSNDTLSFI